LVFLGLLMYKAQAQQYTEYDLKAAYIYNFSKFIKWPDHSFPQDTSSFQITILGDSPITEVLHKAMKGRKVGSRDIHIRVVHKVEQIGSPHILFVSKNMQKIIPNIVKQCGNKPILIVGDVLDGFCQSGGVINFTPKSSKFRFEINNEAAQHFNLKISSKLLALSRIVTSDEIKF